MDAQAINKDSSTDLALAAELQAALLPKRCPSDCPHQVAAARNRMCGSVGGDFYDFLRINEEQIAIVIGDVVGHGVRASLVMAQIMGYLRSLPPALSRPQEVVTALNRLLIQMGERTGNVLHCTMFYTVIDTPTGTSFFVNTGHPCPFICDTSKCIVVDSPPGNLPLGVDEFDPVAGCHTFVPGERLVLYTDGLIEAANPAGEVFGNARLHEIVEEFAAGAPEPCADAVFDAVRQFRQGEPQMDDETIVVIDRV